MSQNTQTNEQGSHVDPLSMSDDAFAELDPSYFEQAADNADGEEQDTEHEETDTLEEDNTQDESSEDADDEEDADPQDEADDEDDSADDDDAEEDQDSDTEEENDGETDDDTTDDTDSEDGDADEADDNEDSDKDESDSDAVDYKAEYEKLMTPFRANGREMQVKNADEAIKLMQMGANYNKKMSAIKPSLKTVKLLDKHGLNDESRINHLIDLSRGDKGAIQKLLKDSGVDPMDFNTDEESEYRPNTYNVDDREMELDEVLDTLQDSPSYNQTLDLVSNKWDDASKQIIANNPRVLEVLDTQMANGVYERVSTEVERLRAFGQLSGVSDIEAYKQIGDQMAEQGAFNDLASQKGNNQDKTNTQQKPPARRTVRKKPDAKLKQKKRAASSTKTKPASKAPADFNPLGMSDEEFEKQFDPNLL